MHRFTQTARNLSLHISVIPEQNTSRRVNIAPEGAYLHPRSTPTATDEIVTSREPANLRTTTAVSSSQRRHQFTIPGIPRHQRGPADRVRPLPARARTGAERTGGTSGRTRPDRWNIGPVTAHHTGPCRPLQAPGFAAGGGRALVFPGAVHPIYPVYRRPQVIQKIIVIIYYSPLHCSRS